VTQLRNSIIWRLVFWFLALSLIPIGVTFVFVQRQVRENIIAIQADNAFDHARMYFFNVEAAPAQGQTLAVSTMAADGNTFFMLDRNGVYLTHSIPEKVGRSAAEDFSPALLRQILENTSVTLRDDEGGRLIGTYSATPTGPVAVSVGNIEIKSAEMALLTRNIMLQLSGALILVSLGASFGAGLAVFAILRPVTKLTNYVTEASRDNFNATFDDSGLRGELAVLSASIKNLVANAQTSIASLESQIADRTRETEHRNNLLKAVTDVGRAMTSFRNLSELLQQTTYLINEHFGYYHTGVFLLDEHKEYAVLSATNSEGGRRMLEKKHQLKVGETGIVGYVAQNAKARIALDVGADAVYFDNPDLPGTRSEMALPLVVGGRVLGALDVQSTESQAFSEEDIATLQILAEQLAVAIQNANLFAETEKALESARMVYGEMSRVAWGKILRDQPRVSFIATSPITEQIHSQDMEPNLAKAVETGDVVLGGDNLTICVPIKIRGQSIGAIRLKKSEIAEAWTQDETNLAIALSDQLSGALESARLYQESQRRAARESLVSDISTRINAVSHTDAIMRETALELGQAIGQASVTFQLLDQFDEKKAAKGQRNP